MDGRSGHDQRAAGHHGGGQRAQALVLIGAGVAGFLAYRRVMQLVNDLEARQIAPLREKVEAILGGRQER